MTHLDRIALISDVHGNLTALEAVLADIDARGITRIYNLGDYVGKGPRGSAVVDLCQERCEVNVQGNWDDFIPDPSMWPEGNPSLTWWHDELRPEQRDWLKGLPFSHDLVMSGRRIRLFHASADSVHHRVRFDHDGEEFLSMFANTPATGDGPTPTVVGYGDTHDSFCETDLGLTLFNTGSVGNSLDETTPLYVILEGTLEGPDPAPFSIQFVRVPYDVEAELAASEALGAPEHELYVAELRDGRYRGDVRRGDEPTYHRRAATSPPTAVEPIEPDTKDWTWVLELPCPDCGFDAGAVRPDDVGRLVTAFTEPWWQVLQRSDARTRPEPAVWSALEYACHVRDVCRLFEERTRLMLEQDAPTFDNWDQDVTAVEGRYGEQDPSTVAAELSAAAESYARGYDTVTEPEWARTGLRSNGSEFTVLTLAQYGLHDLRHHLHDVGASPAG
ncbi:metallophosphoesterase family protein [Luteipulveratus flavus]|uniref:metallophosphoesterase family protein n=1 Tax=Luteipulveratus flavus TaxID=3031728 RepID=UPI003211DF66